MLTPEGESDIRHSHRGPVGNFSEYYSDLDIILDDQLWKPSVVEGARGLIMA